MPVLVNDTDFSTQGYVAPTVFLKADKYLSNYNYYGTLQAAIDKYLYLANKGGRNSPPVGIKTFINNNTAQTLGINCDFYAYVDNVWQLVSYSWLKTRSVFPPVVFRFMATDGGGTYYAIFDGYYFGLSAISITNVDPAKLTELDLFWREVQVMKYRYNSFVGFLNTLSQKELNSIEQRVFNEGLLLLNNLSNQMQQVRGITIIYDSSGKVGLPVMVLIALVVVLSVAAAWTVNSIAAERERTRRINDSYDLNKWIIEKKQEIGMQVSSGQISQQSANDILVSLDQAANVANKIATDAAKPKTGLFGDIANVLKWAAIGYIGFMVVKSTNKKRVANG